MFYYCRLVLRDDIEQCNSCLTIKIITYIKKMDIQFRIDKENRGSFFVDQEGRQVAELDFEVNDNILNAYHTGVRPELEGQGIAGRLFDEMVRYARKNEYKVIPSCSYILAKFRRHPDNFADLWYHAGDEPTGEACGIRPKRQEEVHIKYGEAGTEGTSFNEKRTK